ncbi:lipoyl(octanoyl) transferase LipB [Neiella marina]|uniref:Octanoyltransferase n=1 Tax=Neiella holothuriorum TaxID=2870530 RepID=A0ABS7EEH2_9GAMM|nr:lipoyl(octanoyl) transferase LipB [Neiella holothuriorum]MBW8190726.1 lipoyl(octanoyl) transferase LipB [Neiella holothuriorum]
MSSLIIRSLGQQPYQQCWQWMQDFTNQRGPETPDELWLLEHDPVFTLGQAGKEEHILSQTNIPIVKADRGGQVTYHGPGQLIIYLLLDLRRLKITVRDLVTHMEQAIIELLAQYQINAYAKCDAPGVYVDEAKIASLGLRVRKGCTFHGLALNVDMDLQPFLTINPCGYAGMAMTQSSTLGGPATTHDAAAKLAQRLAERLGHATTDYKDELPSLVND